MDRREFLNRAGLVATWAAIPITIGACSSDDGGPTAPDPAEEGDVTGTVGGPHSHSGAVVTAAQITSGQSVNLTLSGNGHTHELTLTADDVIAIGAGTRVTGQSSNDAGHEHSVTFN